MHGMRAVVLFVSVLWTILEPPFVHADDSDPARFQHVDHVPIALLLNVRCGPESALSASEFFDELRTSTGAQNLSFSAPVIYALGWKIRSGSLAVGIDASYTETVARSIGVTPVLGRDLTQVLGYRSVNENIGLESTALALTAEYSPSSTQFREYLGVAVGVARTSTTWNEDVSSTYAFDSLQSGLRYGSTRLVPLARFTAGLELRFDNVRSNTTGSLIVELSYTLSPNRHQPFAMLPSNDDRFKDVRDRSFSIGQNSVRLLVGLQLSTLLPRRRSTSVSSLP